MGVETNTAYQTPWRKFTEGEMLKFLSICLSVALGVVVTVPMEMTTTTVKPEATTEDTTGRLLSLPVPEKCANRPKHFEHGGHHYFFSGDEENFTDHKVDWLPPTPPLQAGATSPGPSLDTRLSSSPTTSPSRTTRSSTLTGPWRPAWESLTTSTMTGSSGTISPATTPNPSSARTLSNFSNTSRPFNRNLNPEEIFLPDRLV